MLGGCCGDRLVQRVAIIFGLQFFDWCAPLLNRDFVSTGHPVLLLRADASAY